MFRILQGLTIVLAAVAMTPALAHALELPGKMRLPKETYFAVQPIYYPGFTFIGGFGEIAAVLASLLLAVVTPTGTAGFWLTVGGFLSLLCMHGLYWVFTHPVNNFWLKDVRLKGMSREFFSFHPLKRTGDGSIPGWMALRDRWEYSHVARAAFALLGLILLVTAAIIDR